MLLSGVSALFCISRVCSCTPSCDWNAVCIWLVNSICCSALKSALCWVRHFPALLNLSQLCKHFTQGYSFTQGPFLKFLLTKYTLYSLLHCPQSSSTFKLVLELQRALIEIKGCRENDHHMISNWVFPVQATCMTGPHLYLICLHTNLFKSQICSLVCCCSYEEKKKCQKV